MAGDGAGVADGGGGFGFGCRGCAAPTSQSKMGEVMSVVTTAMMTSVAKSAGEMMPRWSPILMMISSISPRAFISVPMPSASRLRMPVARAASQQATPLPRIAAASTSAGHQPEKAGIEQADLGVQSRVGEEERQQQGHRERLDARR